MDVPQELLSGVNEAIIFYKHNVALQSQSISSAASKLILGPDISITSEKMRINYFFFVIITTPPWFYIDHG